MSLTTFSEESRRLAGVEALAGPDRLLGAAADHATNFRSRAMAWVAVATLVRFAFLAPLPLGNGEAYYYAWSRFLDWSYYDHPPLVAWMVRVTTLLGSSPAAVRLGPVLAAGAFGALFYLLAERLTKPRAAFFALVLVTALPVFVGSSFILNPEAPLAPLWVAYLLVIERMRTRNEAYLPLAAGALLGAAFLAKYTAVLLVPTTLLYLATSTHARRWLRRPSLYGGGVIALLLAAPVIGWNAARGWPSVRLHLLERASVGVPVAGENTVNHLVEITSSSGTSPLESLSRVLVGQLIAYSPLLAPLLVIGLVRCLRRMRGDDRYRFLAAFSWPVLLVLLAAMTEFKDAEQHWTMVAVMPAAIAAGSFVDQTWERSRTLRIGTVAGVALSAIVFLLINVHVRTSAILRLIPADHYDARADISNELAGWPRIRASLAQVANQARGEVVLASNHYSLCGRMLFETHDEPAVYCPTARRSAFNFFGRGDPPPSATVVTLTSDIHEELPAGVHDRTCTLADEVDIDRAGRRVARYFVHTCPPVSSESNARASR